MNEQQSNLSPENWKELEHNLPTFAELQQTPEQAFAYDEFLKLVHTPPPDIWVKNHDQLKIKVKGSWVPYRYLPIDKVEFLLHRVFGAKGWKREVLREGIMLNSMYVTIRLWYKIPKTNEWLFHDGVGAQGIQVDKDESPANLAAIKFDAIQKGLPSAASYALGNAAEKIGELFGANINKVDTESLNAWGGVWNPIYEPEPNGSGYANQQQQVITSGSVNLAPNSASIGEPKTMEAVDEITEKPAFVLEY